MSKSVEEILKKQIDTIIDAVIITAGGDPTRKDVAGYQMNKDRLWRLISKEVWKAVDEVEKVNQSNGRYNACAEIRSKLTELGLDNE